LRIIIENTTIPTYLKELKKRKPFKKKIMAYVSIVQGLTAIMVA
jgi:hypothetical protein